MRQYKVPHDKAINIVKKNKKHEWQNKDKNKLIAISWQFLKYNLMISGQYKERDNDKKSILHSIYLFFIQFRLGRPNFGRIPL